MILELYIHHCMHAPPYRLPPSLEKTLRIQIQGPLESIQKLLPNVTWDPIRPSPQAGELKLAGLTYQKLYGHGGLEGIDNAPVVRDECLARVMEDRKPLE